ncbi:MAG: hypothetical protein J1F03_00005 [Oscillospiraceae bacterium]|nr:hypothetical protein [Oscillospiraceae bacterium]
MEKGLPTAVPYPKLCPKGALKPAFAMYFIKNNHEAIISREIFEKVQE